ncbi:MAG: hypothetical protein KA715_13060 [Xanthomonadaceae bacterium]|nr:hypothetical protein [Xanthomonadaceae bacterium]
MKLLRTLFFSALAGIALFAWFSPQIIGWYFAPPVNMLVNCRPAVDWSLDVYKKAMLAGGGVGIVVGAVIYALLMKNKKPSSQAAQ